MAGNFTTEDFNVDDIVLYTYSQKTGATGIKSVEVAETVKGALTNYTVGKQAVVGGETYKYSENIANGASSTLINKNIEVEVVLDKYGYAIDINDNGVKNYAVVLNVATGTGDFSDETKAQLLLTDGTTTGTVNLTNTTLTSEIDTLEKGDIVTYTINSKGKYTLTEVSDVQDATGVSTNTALVTNGVDTLDGAFGSGYALKANGKTTFLVKDSAGNYTAYTGIKNVPTVKRNATTSDGTNKLLVNSYAKSGAVAATLVYVDASKYANVTSADTLFILGKSSTKVTEDEKIGSYYTYDAIINGEITKINSATKLSSFELYNAVSYDSNNVATVGTALPTKGTGTVAKANDVIGLNGSYYNYTNDCKVFYINVDGDIIPTSVNAISTDANDNVWFKLVNSEVTYIFIQEVAGVQTPALSSDVQILKLDVTSTAIDIDYYVEDGTAHTFTVEEIGDLLTAAGWTASFDGTNWAVKKGYENYLIAAANVNENQNVAVTFKATGSGWTITGAPTYVRKTAATVKMTLANAAWSDSWSLNFTVGGCTPVSTAADSGKTSKEITFTGCTFAADGEYTVTIA